MGKKTAKYLRGRAPLRLVFDCKIGKHSRALKIEAAFKKLSKIDKEKIVENKTLDSLLIDSGASK